MKTFSVNTKLGLSTDAHTCREVAGGAAPIVVSEKAKRQIGSQASEGKTPANFVEGFPEFGEGTS